DFAGGGFGQAGLFDEPLFGGECWFDSLAPTSKPRLQFPPNLADRLRQLVAARWRFAEPEGDCRRRAFGVGDTDGAADDLRDQPRRVAELEDVAGVAFDGEVFESNAGDIFQLGNASWLITQVI